MKVKENPFYVLSVTPYDTLETINEKYDEKAFMDEDNERVYEDARQILSSPNKRLSAEVRWFYNLVSPIDNELRKIERYQDYDDNDFLELDNKLDLEYATPRENLLFNLEKLPYITKTYAALFITTLDRGYTETCESESIHDLLDSINTTRRRAKLPLCKDITLLTNEVKGLLEDIKNALNLLLQRDDNEIIEIANLLMENIVSDGKAYGLVIEYFINAYAIKVHDALEIYKNRIFEEVDYCRNNYSEEHELDNLCNLVRRFDYIAQPIQLLLRDRGQAELQEESVDVANEVRDLALFYNNEKGKPELSIILLNLEMELFSELPAFYSKLEEDKVILTEIKQKNEYYDKAYEICENCLATVEKNPQIGLGKAKRLVMDTQQLLNTMMSKQVDNKWILDIKDMIASTMLSCIISYGNETKDWQNSSNYLETIRRYATKPETIKRINDNAAILRKNIQDDNFYGGMEPIDEAPSLSTINGTGTRLYGHSDDMNGTYVAVLCLCFFFIPLIPIARYRVSDFGGNRYRFYGKLPLTTANKIHALIGIVASLYVVSKFL